MKTNQVSQPKSGSFVALATRTPKTLRVDAFFSKVAFAGLVAACVLGVPVSTQAGNLGTDLVLYLPMDGGIADAGFHQVDLEVEGSPSSTIDAKAGDSRRFDGNGDGVQLMPWTADAAIPDREHVSVSLWFKAEADTSNLKRILFDDTGSRGKQDTLAARINWALTPSQLQATCIRDQKQVSLSVEFTDTSAWHHVVVVKDGDRFAMYLDGAKVAEEADLDTASSSTVNAAVGDSFLGKIDEVRVYRRAVTAQDVTDLNAAAALTTAEIWRGHYFNQTDNTGSAADDQDGDGDHSPNIWERATGTSPVETASVSLPVPVLFSESGSDYLSIQYRRLAGGTGTTGINYSKDGLTWQVQTRSDLTDTEEEWASGSTQVEAVGTPVNNGDGTETVTVRREVNTGIEPVSFLKVGVE